MTLAREMIELLLQTARIMEAQASEHDLRAPEWMALRFLARANKISRTPSALADALALTRATTSQIIKLLEDKAFLTRQRSESDGRSVLLRVTRKGERVLADDPLGKVLTIVDELDPDEQATIGQALRRALTSPALNHGQPRVNVCRDCFFLGRNNARSDTEEFTCHLTSATLDAADIDLRCVFFQAPR